jgi:4-hydroxy 2-oxovalerate aldolase
MRPGVPVIEVTHGDGLGGSSFNYGFSAVPEQDLIATAVATAKQAKIAFLMLPGVGTTDDIRQAADNGASICRIATHCTEADISIQHFGLARSIGLETVGFLMMAHSQPPEVAREAGADHGRRRRPVRLRRRLGRRADPGRRQ